MTPPKSAPSSVRYLPEILVVAVVLVYGFFFGFEWNAQQVATVRWWGGTAPASEVPLFRAMIGSFLVGVAVMAVLASVGRIERLFERNRLRKRLRELQEENARLRNVPEDSVPRGGAR